MMKVILIMWMLRMGLCKSGFKSRGRLIGKNRNRLMNRSRNRLSDFYDSSNMDLDYLRDEYIGNDGTVYRVIKRGGKENYLANEDG